MQHLCRLCSEDLQVVEEAVFYVLDTGSTADDILPVQGELGVPVAGGVPHC